MLQSLSFIEADLTANLFRASFVNSKKHCWKEASNVIKNSSDRTKTKYDCLAYLFELCYELLLSAASNVSQNPRFEAFPGQHLLSLFVLCNL